MSWVQARGSEIIPTMTSDNIFFTCSCACWRRKEGAAVLSLLYNLLLSRARFCTVAGIKIL